MNKNITSIVAAVVWLIACLGVDHIYHLASGRSEVASIAFFLVMGAGIFVIGQLGRMRN